MLYILIALIVTGSILSVIRLVMGRHTENRVVAIDVLTTITSGLIVVFAHISNNPLFLDVALVYAILSFTAVIAIARYLEGGI